MIDELIFVYNAESGKVNAAFDIAHKIISPTTYNCSLCSLTFDTFSENKQWREFRDSSKTKMTFLHRDEFESEFDVKYEYPVVLTNTDDAIAVLLSADIINGFTNVSELIQELQRKTA